MTQTLEFLNALFGDKPDNPYILIWTLQDKKSQWCRSAEAAAEAVKLCAPRNDVYVGVGLSPTDNGSKQRCLADKVNGIVGLWADIDIADQAHKKQNLPPSEEAALALVSTMGIEPTLTIHSGHGLQAWWLFKEPWIFEDSEEHQKAAELAMKWTSTLRSKAKAKQWDVDSVFDLARVLRVPGTMNRKIKGHEVPVRIITHDKDRRYDPSEFEDYIIEAPVEQPASRKKMAQMAELGPLLLNPDATPNFDKFEILREIEPKFNLTWERKRKDFQDQSGSTYDLSLATYGAMAGWNDQEIVDLVIASRRKHGDDLKLRQDYYQRTITKAREAVRKQRAQETIEQISDTPETTTSTPHSKRRLIIDALSAMFGVSIKRIVKYIADQPTYRLETNLGSIMLGEVSNLINQNMLRTKMAAACGKLLPKFKNERWENVAQALLDACEDEALGEEATERGQAKAWLQSYLEERKPIDDAEQAAHTKYPFIKDNNVYIFGASLRQWLVISQGENITAKQMGAVLRAYDCEPETVYVQVGGKDTTRSVWKIPSL